MSNFVKTDHPDFIRDTQTTALLNTNIKGLEAYKIQRDRILRTDRLVEEVNELKNDVQDIKNLLNQIASKL